MDVFSCKSNTEPEIFKYIEDPDRKDSTV